MYKNSIEKIIKLFNSIETKMEKYEAVSLEKKASFL